MKVVKKKKKTQNISHLSNCFVIFKYKYTILTVQCKFKKYDNTFFL